MSNLSNINLLQYNLALLYYNGVKTEMNLEKTFYWYQKAAEIGDKNAMNNLVICYKNGQGTKENLEKAFYWYQKAAENSKINLNSKDYKFCEKCKQPYINYKWCQQ